LEYLDRNREERNEKKRKRVET
jgi:hypothetical protein